MFKNREQAGKQLAQKLLEFKGRDDVVVLGIPRGGVVVAKEVASSLTLPSDIIIVKKIGAPQNVELAIGAVGPSGSVYWDENLLRKLNINKRIRNQELRIKEKEREDREKQLRGNKPTINLKNKTVILVDDGIATGATVMAAAAALRREQAKELVLAVPVTANDTFRSIERYFDKVIVLEVSSEFYAVGQFYEDFPQISDQQVARLLVNSNL